MEEQQYGSGEDINPSAWIESPPAPWRRYGARLLDTVVNGVIGWIAIGLILYMIFPASTQDFIDSLNPIVDYMMSTFIGCLLTGAITGACGSSLGKWIFGVRVEDLTRKPAGIVNGMIRDFNVYVRGLAFGIPFIALFTLNSAYTKLRDTGTTSWDENKYIVTYRPNGALQYFLNVIGIVLFILMQALIRSL